MGWGAIAGAVGAIGGGLLAQKGSKDAANASAKASIAGQQIISEDAAKARDDVISLYPSVYDSIRGGYGEGLNILFDGGNKQQQAFRKGNIGAQKTLNRTQQNVINALFGRPTQSYDVVDLGGYELQRPRQQQKPSRSTVPATDRSIPGGSAYSGYINPALFNSSEGYARYTGKK